MGTPFENGISVSFWAFLENNANIFYLKTGFSFFWACDGNLWKIMPISSIWKRNFRVFFWACDGNLIWKRDFRVFWACDGNLWKIMPISSIWKRDFLFLGLWWEPLENNANIFYLKTEFPCFFLGLWWEHHLKTGFPFLGLVMGTSGNNANIFYLKTGFPFFWACDGNLWKIMPISSIWKRDFRCFFWLVMATSGK